MKIQNKARVLVALAALACTLSATPAMAAHAKHACVKTANCTYAKTGKHNKLCERGTHTKSHASEVHHNDANGHGKHK